MRKKNYTNENSGRILPEFLRDKPGERTYGWASLFGQTSGHSTGNGAERPVDVRLAPTEAGLYSWKGDKP